MPAEGVSAKFSFHGSELSLDFQNQNGLKETLLTAGVRGDGEI